MNETKHTPGPWEVENCGVGKQANKLFVWPAKGTNCDFHAVATIHEDFGNKWANARLIAAAPELLEACEQIVWKVFATSAYPEIRKDIVIKMAEAAISKAKGE